MRIKRGSTRVVILVFGLAFKFPRVKQQTTYGRGFHFLRGLLANVTEGATYIACGRPRFMAPVVSLGFVNIQSDQGEDEPTEAEMEAVLSRLSDKAWSRTSRMDKHPFFSSNFRRRAGCLRMIDFGDAFGQAFPLSSFLLTFKAEFQEALDSEQTHTATRE